MIRGMDMSGHILLLLFPSIENKNKKSTVRYMKQFLKQRSKAISQARMSEKVRGISFLLGCHSPFISMIMN